MSWNVADFTGITQVPVVGKEGVSEEDEGISAGEIMNKLHYYTQ